MVIRFLALRTFTEVSSANLDPEQTLILTAVTVYAQKQIVTLQPTATYPDHGSGS